MEVLSCLKENSFHHMDAILLLGEISDRLYFVTSGQVGVFVNMEDEFIRGAEDAEDAAPESARDQDLKPAPEPEASKRRAVLLGTLNVGSNFNHISALLS